LKMVSWRRFSESFPEGHIIEKVDSSYVFPSMAAVVSQARQSDWVAVYRG